VRKWEGTTQQGIQRGRRGRKRGGSEEEDKDVDEGVSAVLLVSSKAFKALFFRFRIKFGTDILKYGEFLVPVFARSVFFSVPFFTFWVSVFSFHVTFVNTSLASLARRSKMSEAWWEKTGQTTSSPGKNSQKSQPPNKQTAHLLVSSKLRLVQDQH
jgi:hypothetical protein